MGEADSLGVLAYKELRHQIVTLQLAPGAALSEAMLEAHLRCGRAAVRFAIQHLRTERLVRVVPRGGTTVADLSVAEIGQAYQVRTYLEILAGRMCARRCGSEELARLGNALEEAQRAERAGDPLAALAAVQRFYRGMHENAQNAILLDFVRIVATLTERFEYFCARELERAPLPLETHLLVLEALRRRDPDAVETRLEPIGRHRAETILELVGVTLRLRNRARRAPA